MKRILVACLLISTQALAGPAPKRQFLGFSTGASIDMATSAPQERPRTPGYLRPEPTKPLGLVSGVGAVVGLVGAAYIFGPWVKPRLSTCRKDCRSERRSHKIRDVAVASRIEPDGVHTNVALRW